jgi:hypothetical protein
MSRATRRSIARSVLVERMPVAFDRIVMQCWRERVARL